jgi:hypothetical protein
VLPNNIEQMEPSQDLANKQSHINKNPKAGGRVLKTFLSISNKPNRKNK